MEAFVVTFIGKGLENPSLSPIFISHHPNIFVKGKNPTSDCSPFSYG